MDVLCVAPQSDMTHALLPCNMRIWSGDEDFVSSLVVALFKGGSGVASLVPYLEISAERALVLAGPRVVDLVVGAHEGADVGVNGALERRVVHLKLDALVDVLRDAATVGFLFEKADETNRRRGKKRGASQGVVKCYSTTDTDMRAILKAF
jgi:hypothetical protein